MSGEQKQSKRIYLSYKDDNGIIKSGYVNLIKDDLYTITFETNSNRITINKSNLIKMKEGI